MSVARLSRFAVSGGLAAAIFFACSFSFLALGWRPALANLAAYAIAFGVGYGLQRGWTFEARHAHGQALPRYLVLQLACAALSAAAGELGASVLELPALAVSLGSTLACGAVSYLASSLWVFPVRRG